jgi:hypothetical protein
MTKLSYEIFVASFLKLYSYCQNKWICFHLESIPLYIYKTLTYVKINQYNTMVDRNSILLK